VHLLAVAPSNALVGQTTQILGALMVLAGFAAVQFRVLHHDSAAYLALNLVGSSVLAALALADAQYGFLLLEGVWAVVSAGSAVALVRARRGRRRRPRGAEVGERQSASF
jgi:hypothetical protein